MKPLLTKKKELAKGPCPHSFNVQALNYSLHPLSYFSLTQTRDVENFNCSFPVTFQANISTCLFSPPELLLVTLVITYLLLYLE